MAGTNLESQKHGLILTEKDALQIIDARDEALKAAGRVETSYGIINKIIRILSSSPNINQADYATTVCALVETFYCMKNEIISLSGRLAQLENLEIAATFASALQQVIAELEITEATMTRYIRPCGNSLLPRLLNGIEQSSLQRLVIPEANDSEPQIKI